MSKRTKEDRECQGYLNDILEAIGDIRNFTKNISLKDLEKDKKTPGYAVYG